MLPYAVTLLAIAIVVAAFAVGTFLGGRTAAKEIERRRVKRTEMLDHLYDDSYIP